MKIILLSGGAGKRLWPLSSDVLPKPFMKVMNNKMEPPVSMLQKTWRTLAEKYGTEPLYVAGNAVHESILREQLGAEAQLILEPAKRDTFAAISLAASYLADRRGAKPEETILVLPVDAYADPSFYDGLIEMDRIIQQDLASIALVGIVPKYPAEKFGYIVPMPAGHSSACHYVQGFFEKPDRRTAQEMIERGALWNGGVFAFRLSYLQEVVTRHHFPWAYPDLLAQYDTIPRISFDYMVVEPEKRIAYVPFEGVWTDLGTWSEMVRVLGDRDGGTNIIKDSHCQDTHVINHLGIPIIVSGISGAIIVAGPEGILICNQNRAHQIKPLVDRILPDLTS